MLRHMKSHVKTIMIVIIVLFVASCFAGYGLYSRGGKNQDGTSDYAVATVNGENVMRSEIEKISMRIAEDSGKDQEVTSADIPLLRKAALDTIAIEAELEKEIDSKNIEVTNDEIDAEYTKIMDSYPTREEFKASIERLDIKESDIKDDIKKQLSRQKVFATLESEIKVSDTEAHAFYDAAKNYLYKKPAGVLLNIATFRSIESAKLAQKAIAGGAGWDKVMDERKADIETSTPYNKPVLITDQMMVNSFAVIKDYPMNKVLPVIPVTSTDAYVAVKRSKEPARMLSFAEVSADVVAAVKSQKAQTKQNDMYTELLKRAAVVILDPKIFPAEVTSAVKSGDQQ